MASDTRTPAQAQADRDYAVEVAEKRADRRALVEWGEDGAQIANLDQAITFAQTLIEAGAAPKGSTPGGIVASVQHGAEIRTAARPNGLGPMQSIQLIPSINGRPFIMGDLAKALVMESFDLVPGSFKEWMTGERKADGWTAHCSTQKQGQEVVEHTFTWEQAKVAKLSTKSGPWTEYPERQMMYRARGFHVRDEWGSHMLGLHTFEEGRDTPQGVSRARNVTPPEVDPLFADDEEAVDPDVIDVEPIEPTEATQEGLDLGGEVRP